MKNREIRIALLVVSATILSIVGMPGRRASASAASNVRKPATDDKASPLSANASGKVRTPNPKTAYLRLDKNYFEPKTLMSVVRKMLVEARK